MYRSCWPRQNEVLGFPLVCCGVCGGQDGGFLQGTVGMHAWLCIGTQRPKIKAWHLPQSLFIIVFNFYLIIACSFYRSILWRLHIYVSSVQFSGDLELSYHWLPCPLPFFLHILFLYSNFVALFCLCPNEFKKGNPVYIGFEIIHRVLMGSRMSI